MEVGYQHANPRDGRESVLVRFHDERRDETTCILVDAGTGVDVEDLLDEDESLGAILLTHAHLDHYRSLGANLRDGAPIYATPETIEAITARLETGGDHVALENGDEIQAAFEPITDWRTVTDGLRVCPVPAGHAPGACGFVVQFVDEDRRYQLLATGDFSARRAAGYPGLPDDLSVDGVFLTGATNDDVRDQLTAAVSTVVERAVAGSTVLATTSGLGGVHLAYLLAHVGTTEEIPLPVTVAGRVAALWDALEYEHPSVESVRTFRDPDEVLLPGRVTIAGPEVPVAGSSETLFEAIEDDGGATLVQVTSGAFEPERSAGCTVDDYRLSNHPDEATVDAVVEALEPIHVVVTHQQGRAADRYKDKYDSFVWATDDERRYTLYEDGNWSGPEWITDATRRRVRSRQYMGDGTLLRESLDADDVPLPSVERHDDVDLDAEGIDVERLRDAVGIDADGSGVDAADSSAGQPTVTSTGDRVAVPDEASSETSVEERQPSEGQSESNPVDDAARVDDVGAEALEQFSEQLDRIEGAVTGHRTEATVVDAGEGVTLLRLPEDSLADELVHGQTIEVLLSQPNTPTESDTERSNSRRTVDEE